MTRLHWLKTTISLATGYRTRKNRGPRNKRQASTVGWGAETLEPRMMLDSSGVLWGNARNLTLSFAPDAAMIGDQANSLHETLDLIGGRDAWKDAILRAFQTWAVAANIDIGVVSDGGQPFGSPGPTQRDPRFGDIRIGAIPMSSDVLAVSVPHDRLVSGTWVGDVLLNSEGTIRNLDELFSIALHEAGHVLGLEHSPDPLSPMFVHGVSNVTELTAGDLVALHKIYGSRADDVNEGQTGNDSFVDGTRIKFSVDSDGFDGSKPLIVFGDISAPTDVDHFSLRPLPGYTGSVTLQVRTAGSSLLAPKLSVFNENGEFVGQAISNSSEGDIVTVQIDPVIPGETYFLKVEGATQDLFGIGGFSVVATFDDNLTVDSAIIDSLASGAFRFLEQDEIQEQLEEEDGLGSLRDDGHLDDLFEEAVTLETTNGFAEHARYDAIGSIVDPTDVDHYRVESLEDQVVSTTIMTVVVTSLDPGGLIPKVNVFDRNKNLLPSQIIANGNGEYVIQSDNIEPGKKYIIEVSAADASGLFATGNYSLSILFGQQQTVPSLIISGAIDQESPEDIHALHVAQTQLFHFALEVNAAQVDSPTALLASFFDADENLVYQLSARPGETRTKAAVLLQPGSYSVQVRSLNLDGSPLPLITYSLRGGSLSEPVGPPPDDPTANPVFDCPNNPSLFCYPGGITSVDPFLWGSTLDSVPNPPDVSSSEILSQVVGDWWSWYWNFDPETNDPPLAVNDFFETEAGVSLMIDTNSGVLGNDADPDGNSLAAVLVNDSRHGTLSLSIDGTFTYEPDAGFFGTDSFEYLASDFFQQSNTAIVSLVVASPNGVIQGDLNADGFVGVNDIILMQKNFGLVDAVSPFQGDLNQDQVVDRADFSILIQNYGRSSVQMSPAESPSPTVSLRSAGGDGREENQQGDINGNGQVGLANLTLSQQNVSSTPAPSPAASPAVTQPVSLQDSTATDLAIELLSEVNGSRIENASTLLTADQLISSRLTKATVSDTSSNFKEIDLVHTEPVTPKFLTLSSLRARHEKPGRLSVF